MYATLGQIVLFHPHYEPGGNETEPQAAIVTRVFRNHNGEPTGYVHLTVFPSHTATPVIPGHGVGSQAQMQSAGLPWWTPTG